MIGYIKALINQQSFETGVCHVISFIDFYSCSFSAQDKTTVLPCGSSENHACNQCSEYYFLIKGLPFYLRILQQQITSIQRMT